ncbi:MAG TPA: ComEC/Rec2 family competence protein [Planctomycetota bacterium]|jgi:competence protein ComEC|nr:ComEC/Rec2 family competence protein [Planctomycetota bacterium]
MENHADAARAPLERPLFAVAAAVFVGSALGATALLPAAWARALALGAPCAGFAARGRVRGSGWAALVLLLAAAASLRAAPRAPESPTTPERTAFGTWRPTDGAGERAQGTVEGAALGVALVRGTLEAGEEVAVLPGEPATPFARGPEPGPRRRATMPPDPERGPDEVVRLRAGAIGLAAQLTAPLERVRARLLERTSRLPDPLTRALVAGLLFGDLTDLPHGVGDLFVRTGTFHVLAISGLQIALVAILLAGPLARCLAFLARAATAGRVHPGFEHVRAAILLLFVPVAGAGPPVTRSALAWVMSSVAHGFRVRTPFADSPARHMPRANDPLSIWSLALLCECLVHPDAAVSVSVELTYAATLGLILATGPTVRLLRSALPGEGRIAPAGATGRPRPELARVLAQKILDAALYSIAASLAAVLATSAVVWFHFGEWSPAGILATPAIAVPVAWILVAGWVWLLVPGLVPEALLDLPVRGMVSMLGAFDRIPGTPGLLPPRPLALLLIASGATLLALARRPGQAAWLPRVAAAAWGVVLLPWVLAPAGLELHALDVGHGTAVLVRGPGGGVWVFDAGSRDRAEVDREALGPLVRAWDAERIGVVLSHPDRDHAGALDWLVERHPPVVWAGAVPAQVSGRLPHTVPRIDVRPGRMRLPRLDSGPDGPDLELSRSLDVEGNEGSRCLEVRWRDSRIVLCGDAEAEGLATWLASDPGPTPVRLLLFPHHGSETQQLGPLVAALAPAEIWISTSGTASVSRELARRGIQVRSTAVEGPLALELP